MKGILLILLFMLTSSRVCVDDYFARADKYQEMEAVLDYAYAKAISSGIKMQVRYVDSTGNIVEYATN